MMNPHGKIFKSIFKYSMSREIPSYEKGTILSIAFKQFKTSIDKSFEKYIEKSINSICRVAFLGIMLVLQKNLLHLRM